MSNWLENIFKIIWNVQCWELFENLLGDMDLKWTCLPGLLGIYIILGIFIIFLSHLFCVFILWAYSSTFEITIIILSSCLVCIIFYDIVK